MGLKRSVRMDITASPARVVRSLPMTVSLSGSYTIDRVFVCGEEWKFERMPWGVKLIEPVKNETLRRQP